MTPDQAVQTINEACWGPNPIVPKTLPSGLTDLAAKRDYALEQAQLKRIDSRRSRTDRSHWGYLREAEYWSHVARILEIGIERQGLLPDLKPPPSRDVGPRLAQWVEELTR
jgi:hypothetical protein